MKYIVKKIMEPDYGCEEHPDAFDLDAKYIIHASGPWWTDGSKGEEECLRSCYEKAL